MTLLVLILVVFGVKALMDSAKLAAFRTYVTKVNAIADATKSNTTQFFTTLTSSSGQANVNFETKLQGFAGVASDEAGQAAALSVPAELVGAQRDLLLALNFRAEAFSRITSLIGPALGGTDAAAQFNRIAGQMAKLLSSDVIYEQRVVPLIRSGLTAQGITDESVADSSVLGGNTSWIDPTNVTQRVLGYTLASQGNSAPGVNGHQLDSVSVGDTQLISGNALNPTIQFKAGTPVPFTLSILNNGLNDVHGATAEIYFTAAGLPSHYLLTTVTIPVTHPGAEAIVTIPLVQTPPVGQALRLHAEIVPLPGETDTANNHLSFVVRFSH